MKKKIIVSLTLALPILIMAFTERSSTGAPASHTGAPGEKTCATGGCHDDHPINTGTARLSVEIDSGLTHYIPGKTYPVKIRISDPDVKRFGFQVVALIDQTKENAGTFIITDPERTQFMRNDLELTARKYVTYTFSGTDALPNGLGEWTLGWTAPSLSSGNITFYVAAVSANDDGTDKGDVVYTNHLTLIHP